jgi:hypothetical protein
MREEDEGGCELLREIWVGDESEKFCWLSPLWDIQKGSDGQLRAY